jgi:hypothetical protein
MASHSGVNAPPDKLERLKD